MPLVLIEGQYQIVGAAPDGDSVRFYPARASDWELVRGEHRVEPNRQGGAQLRLDGIDALETHYAPPGGVLGVTHQPLDLARAAAGELLTWIGFRDVKRGANETVATAKPARVRGYLLTRFADKYGRCVAFAFKGKPPASTGERVFMDAQQLRKSLNYHMLRQGLAYPTFYSLLYPDLRAEMATIVRSAETRARGIWLKDKTISGFKVSNVAQVQREGYLVPKLYRRLVDYIALNAGDTSLAGFKDYLALRDDRLVILSTGHFTGFDYVVHVQGQTVKLTTPIDDLVFHEA